jgi:hypothetical protein
MRRKCDSWKGHYELDETEPAIRYILRGGTAESIFAQFEAMRTAPNLSKNVYIVTSSLSKTQVATVFDDITKERRPRAHFVQLYWLLTSFFSACSEVGAIGYVVCQPLRKRAPLSISFVRCREEERGWYRNATTAS